ncbi:hypothetical protein AMR72_01145 [Flavobacterium psychrophilum]|nr:hypothetical protein AMR72_01145 [Flavobacterium psychrophilum]AOE51247.1 hypothetical protein ALW18_01145 [Flavobacterium psychrophilum]
MKVFGFITSVIVLMLSLFYIITDFPNLNSFEGFVYFCIVSILILICITGMIINIPLRNRMHKKA